MERKRGYFTEIPNSKYKYLGFSFIINLWVSNEEKNRLFISSIRYSYSLIYMRVGIELSTLNVDRIVSKNPFSSFNRYIIFIQSVFFGFTPLIILLRNQNYYSKSTKENEMHLIYTGGNYYVILKIGFSSFWGKIDF